MLSVTKDEKHAEELLATYDTASIDGYLQIIFPLDVDFINKKSIETFILHIQNRHIHKSQFTALYVLMEHWTKAVYYILCIKGIQNMIYKCYIFFPLYGPCSPVISPAVLLSVVRTAAKMWRTWSM